MTTTTITLNVALKKRLDRLKLHSRESYNDVLARLLQQDGGTVDTESLAETVAILSNPPVMRSLARSLEDVKKGRVYADDEV